MYNMFVNTVLPSPNETGCYYSPTIIEVNPSMTIWKEEVKKYILLLQRTLLLIELMTYMIIGIWACCSSSAI